MTTEEINAIYTFHITEKLKPDFRFTVAVQEWLCNNLQELTDDDDNVIFSKVNKGYNENTLKTFGAKPTYVDKYIACAVSYTTLTV